MWRLEFSFKTQGVQKRTKRVERFLCKKEAQRPVVYMSYVGKQLSETEAKRQNGNQDSGEKFKLITAKKCKRKQGKGR